MFRRAIDHCPTESIDIPRKYKTESIDILSGRKYRYSTESIDILQKV